MQAKDHTGPHHTMLSSAPSVKPFFARFFVRNRMNQPFLATQCLNVQQIITTGDQAFSNFSGRNPWIFSDSVRGLAWVFVDPETAVETEQPL
jgi:hypothetical protein